MCSPALRLSRGETEKAPRGGGEKSGTPGRRCTEVGQASLPHGSCRRCQTTPCFPTPTPHGPLHLHPTRPGRVQLPVRREARRTQGCDLPGAAVCRLDVSRFPSRRLPPHQHAVPPVGPRFGTPSTGETGRGPPASPPRPSPPQPCPAQVRHDAPARLLPSSCRRSPPLNIAGNDPREPGRARLGSGPLCIRFLTGLLRCGNLLSTT